MNVHYMDKKIDRAITGGQIHLLEVLEYLDRRDNLLYSRSGAQKNFLLTNLDYIRRYALSDDGGGAYLEDYSQRFYLFLFNMFLWKLKRRRVVAIVNALYFSYRTSAVKNALDRFVSTIFLRHATVVIAGGESAKREVMRMGIPEENVKVVYPALRGAFADNDLPRTGGKDGFFEVLFVARLNPIKGLEYLVQAMALLPGKKIRLKVVGNRTAVPDYTKRIEEIVEEGRLGDRVRFEGEVSDTGALLEIYRSADLFVLPSLWDTSPVSLLEAMCVGLPVVATAVGGIPEWVEDGDNGILVPPRDAEALASAIGRLYEDASLREAMAERSLARSAQFRSRSWEDVAREYHEIVHGAQAGEGA